MIDVRCEVCNGHIGYVNDGVMNDIKKSYLKNEKGDYICTECYYSFGLPQGKDQHA